MPPTIDLAFSGGGTLGVAFGGALDVLEQKRPVFRRLIGTSAGAIASLWAAAGLTAREYLKLVPAKDGDPFLFNSFFAAPEGEAVRAAARKKDSETRKLLRAGIDGATDKFLGGLTEKRPRIGEMIQGVFALGKDRFYENAFEGFLDRVAERDNPNKPRPRTQLFALLEFGGIFDPELFRLWLVQHIEKRWPRFDKKTTLKQFQEMTAEVGREASYVVADLTDSKALALNHRTAPECPVVDAVLMSIAIPMVWPETEWRKEWGTYCGHDVEGHFMVDGGVFAGYPIPFLMNRDSDEGRAIFGEPEPANERPAIIGLHFDSTKFAPGDVEVPKDKSEIKFMARISHVVEAIVASQAVLFKGTEEISVPIPVKGHSSLEMPGKIESILRLQTLVNSGRCAMTDHLKKRKLF